MKYLSVLFICLLSVSVSAMEGVRLGERQPPLFDEISELRRNVINNPKTIQNILNKKDKAAAEKLVKKFEALIKACKNESDIRLANAHSKDERQKVESDKRKYWEALFDLSDCIQPFSYKKGVDGMKVFHYKDIFALIDSM